MTTTLHLSTRPDSSILRELRTDLKAAADPEKARFLQGFFKTGRGEYAEGDKFLGVRVPDTRRLIPAAATLSPIGLLTLVRSPIHEERLLGLLAWVRNFERGSSEAREAIYTAYLQETPHINNWDLVDSSAPAIVGGWMLLHPGDTPVLSRMARSPHLWERRIAIIATLALIRAGETSQTFRLARLLLDDRHDLIHKAVGWMLREAGKRDLLALRSFLERHASEMPRTMLRYAIEKLSGSERAHWMSVTLEKTPARGSRRTQNLR